MPRRDHTSVQVCTVATYPYSTSVANKLIQLLNRLKRRSLQWAGQQKKTSVGNAELGFRGCGSFTQIVSAQFLQELQLRVRQSSRRSGFSACQRWHRPRPGRPQPRTAWSTPLGTALPHAVRRPPHRRQRAPDLMAVAPLLDGDLIASAVLQGARPAGPQDALSGGTTDAD